MRLDIGQREKKPPSFLYVVLLLIGDSTPGRERREKGARDIRQDIRYRLKKKELQMSVTLSYLLEI